MDPMIMVGMLEELKKRYAREARAEDDYYRMMEPRGMRGVLVLASAAGAALVLVLTLGRLPV